ncbi:D-aminoacyl-tRNA deacylase [Mucisphaera sp.]|uniref:D-aminoacyl-tRNA deacylase n=1 Tax=Mucisphaera sp. TaxID=2913024 RepID=UPI003D1115D7
MRILLQRVTRGSVTVDGQTLGEIGRGYVLLVGVGPDDNETIARKLAEKIVHLRLFPDDAGRFDRSVLDVQGGALVVSQFTLFGDARKGRRPSFIGAGPPEIAEPLCARFGELLSELGVRRVENGRFGADMRVLIENDGPVTLWLDSDALGLTGP